jgi:uncharacterized cupin superfamily protein
VAGIERRSFNEPDEVFASDDGSRTDFIQVGDNVVMRSVMKAGWSWEQYVKPMGDDASCPLDHREVILSGRIRYLMDDGTEVIGQAGDYLEISPGHLAWVLGDEPCVTIDW